MSQFPLVRLAKQKTLLEGILKYLQKKHRINILLFIHEHGTVRWGELKKAHICNDSTFRAACVELTLLGLADQISIAMDRHEYRLTDLGCVVADIVKRAIRDIEILVNPEKVIAAH